MTDKQIDEALEALDLAEKLVYLHPERRKAFNTVRQTLERQRDENATLRSLLETVLSATESERKVRRIAAKYGIAAAPEDDDA